MKVGIINVTGYAGCELVRILRHHPEVEIASVTGRSAAGQPLGQVFPHLDNMKLEITADLCDGLDLVFSALPHKASAEACIPLLEQEHKGSGYIGGLQAQAGRCLHPVVWSRTSRPYVS